ncbi:MAG: hypothetical protein MUC87_03530 [Bacteroidia bacterium]|jgi:hypothetical protein|nr:hypothetical protein [Bacteroidia bacterium]
MNQLINHLSSVWTALVFGAVFNFLTINPDETLFIYVLKTVIGGVVWLTFQVWADYLKHQNARNRENKKENDNSNQN